MAKKFRGKPITVECYVSFGDSEYVNYDTLTQEQKELVGQCITESAGRSLSDYLATEAHKAAYTVG